MSTKPSQQSIELAVSPDEWVDLYGDYLYAFALSRLRDSSLAEEAVQETFLAGVRAQHLYQGLGSQRGWLMGILKRKVIDLMRKRSRQQQLEGVDYNPKRQLFDQLGQWKPGVLPNLSPDHHLESQELWQVVRTCLELLPQSQADVFVLSIMEEMNTNQICEALDISASNLFIRLHRARLGLAKCVGTKWFELEGSGG
jgi:RNA polymerase sigma-70 factor (TIGR02943 family)